MPSPSKQKRRKRTFSPQSVQFLDSSIGDSPQLYLFERIIINNGCKLVFIWLYLQPNRFIMGQTAFTVRMDSEVKKQFDELCKDFGMSSNTAFNIFARTVIKKQRIPFEVESEREARLRQARETFERIERYKAENNLPELTMEEIDEEIRKCREERRQMNNNIHH